MSLPICLENEEYAQESSENIDVQVSTGQCPLLNESPILDETLANGVESRSCLDSSPLNFISIKARNLFNLYWNNYVWLMLSASIGFALTLTCMKILSEDVSVFQVTAVRSLFGFVALFGMCRREGVSFFEPREKIPLMIARGIVGSVAFLFLAVATFELPLSESAFMANSYPVIAAVLSWLFRMERLGWLSWIGIAGCVIGNALMAHPPFLFGEDSEWGTKRVIGVSSAFIGNLLTAASFVLIRYIGKSVHSSTLTGYMHFFGFIVTIPFMAIGCPKPVNLQLTKIQLLCYATICITGVFAQVVQSRSLQIGPPSKTTTLLMTNMLLAGFIGVVALSESMSLLSAIGAGVIVTSVMIVTMQKSPDLRPHRPEIYQSLITATDENLVNNIQTTTAV